ncbi:MAG: cation:proton antiporter [Kiritimatiellae bacterium]|nr:cation:proton antiporter [Kiritimatiellia bacterium]
MILAASQFEAAFFQDLAWLMAIAGIAAAIFARLGWPKVFGYLLAGIILSPNTWGGSPLADPKSIPVVGQLGIVFLMFAMGLGFSFSEMKKIRAVVIPVALIDTIVMTIVGYTVARHVFGWDPVASIFLGVAISDSATTLLVKVIDEMKWSGRPFVKYVVGTSVCEDIVCVGSIAVAMGVGSGNGLSVSSALASVGGLLLFFLATLVLGFLFVPRILDSAWKRGGDEALILSALGILFLVSYVAYCFEFSVALGAFVVGIIMSTGRRRARLVTLVEPLKSMFAAVFFVSVGLLVDPSAWLHDWWMILVLVLVVVVGKAANCTVGAILSGEDMKPAVQIGMSLAQTGEFAFMVAMMYLGQNGASESPMYQVVIAVSLATSFLNPFLIRRSEPVSGWLGMRILGRHPGFATVMNSYRAMMMRFRQNASTSSGPMRLVRRNFALVALILVLNFALAVVCGMIVRSKGLGVRYLDEHAAIVFSALSYVAMVASIAPIWMLAAPAGDALARVVAGPRGESYVRHIGGVVKLAAIGAAGAAWTVEFIGIAANLHPDETWAQIVLAVVLICVLATGWRFFQRQARRAGARLAKAVTADERLRNFTSEMPDNPLTLTVPAEKIDQMEVPCGSPAVGRSVAELGIRANTGANIIRVNRNGSLYRNTGPDWVFRAGDLVVAYGDKGQMAALRRLLGVAAR